MHVFQIDGLEKSKETAIKKFESEEVLRLQRQVLSLEDQLVEKTKVTCQKSVENLKTEKT